MAAVGREPRSKSSSKDIDVYWQHGFASTEIPIEACSKGHCERFDEVRIEKQAEKIL